MAITRNTENTNNYNVSVTRAKWVNDSIAFDVVVNNVNVNGCWYRTGTKDGKEWEMLSLPQYKGNDGKYYNYAFFPINRDDLKKNIISQIKQKLQ